MKFQDKKRNGFEAKDPSFMGSDGVYKKIDVSSNIFLTFYS